MTAVDPVDLACRLAAKMAARALILKEQRRPSTGQLRAISRRITREALEAAALFALSNHKIAVEPDAHADMLDDAADVSVLKIFDAVMGAPAVN